nr:MAG TPA: hypothetical protein [Caudoviricetes sp.]
MVYFLLLLHNHLLLIPMPDANQTLNNRYNLFHCY